MAAEVSMSPLDLSIGVLKEEIRSPKADTKTDTKGIKNDSTGLNR